MRIFVAALCAVAAFGASMSLHDSGQRMAWEQAVEYCRSLDAYLPTLNAMEAAYVRSFRSVAGKTPYAAETYWSADQDDIEGAYAYDFSRGLHSVDFKGARYRVMCIQSD
ncbi:hypothetical protein FACS1894103_6160 [Campylobacterota bacterium]|nr:hypothetical protein FACS1894103_6160 [Campylobacterota bacterium]